MPLGRKGEVGRFDMLHDKTSSVSLVSRSSAAAPGGADNLESRRQDIKLTRQDNGCSETVELNFEEHTSRCVKFVTRPRVCMLSEGSGKSLRKS